MRKPANMTTRFKVGDLVRVEIDEDSMEYWKSFKGTAVVVEPKFGTIDTYGCQHEPKCLGVPLRFDDYADEYTGKSYGPEDHHGAGECVVFFAGEVTDEEIAEVFGTAPSVAHNLTCTPENGGTSYSCSCGRVRGWMACGQEGVEFVNKIIHKALDIEEKIT